MVTGAGSVVGQGIVKALRLSTLPLKIFCADIDLAKAALYRADTPLLIPRVEVKGALEEIIKVLEKHCIDVVMIGSEYEVTFFSTHKEEIMKRTGAIVIVAPSETIKIADDKWLTTKFLKKHGLPFAEAYIPSSNDEALSVSKSWGYPIMLKTRRGTSSRHVYLVRTADELIQQLPKTPLPMLQRVICEPSVELENEFTCSIFSTSRGNLLGPFTARRTIRGGSSWLIEIAPFPSLHEVLYKVANALPFVASLNIQLMKTDDGHAVPFELNARFSSTTAVRAHFGFNEPEMAVQDLFYNEPVADPKIRSGIAMRYVEELFIEGVNFANLSLNHKGKINRWL